MNSKLQPNILWLASLPSFLAKDFFVIDLLLRWVKTYKPYWSWYDTITLTCFSMLVIYFLIGFLLIAIFFFLDPSNIPIIFMNSTLQCLNISLVTWPESQMTREIQPVKDSSNSSICFLRGLFCEFAVAS